MPYTDREIETSGTHVKRETNLAIGQFSFSCQTGIQFQGEMLFPALHLLCSLHNDMNKCLPSSTCIQKLFI